MLHNRLYLNNLLLLLISVMVLSGCAPKKHVTMIYKAKAKYIKR